MLEALAVMGLLTIVSISGSLATLYIAEKIIDASEKIEEDEE